MQFWVNFMQLSSTLGGQKIWRPASFLGYTHYTKCTTFVYMEAEIMKREFRHKLGPNLRHSLLIHHQSCEKRKLPWCGYKLQYIFHVSEIAKKYLNHKRENCAITNLYSICKDISFPPFVYCNGIELPRLQLLYSLVVQMSILYPVCMKDPCTAFSMFSIINAKRVDWDHYITMLKIV